MWYLFAQLLSWYCVEVVVLFLQNSCMVTLDCSYSHQSRVATLLLPGNGSATSVTSVVKEQWGPVNGDMVSLVGRNHQLLFFRNFEKK